MSSCASSRTFRRMTPRCRAKQLEMQRQEAAIREANRKQEEEALRKKAEEDRIAKRKAEEEAKRQARKKVELYRKKKQVWTSTCPCGFVSPRRIAGGGRTEENARGRQEASRGRGTPEEQRSVHQAETRTRRAAAESAAGA